MAQRGVSLHQIGGWLGHRDSRTSLLYAHHHPDVMGDALPALWLQADLTKIMLATTGNA